MQMVTAMIYRQSCNKTAEVIRNRNQSVPKAPSSGISTTNAAMMKKTVSMTSVPRK